MTKRHVSHRTTAAVSRRSVMAGLSALGAGALGCGTPRYRPTSTFPVGVASGDATADGALLTTRYLGPGHALQVAVAEGDAPVPASAPRRPVALADGGFASLTVDGLRAATWHRYVFEAVDALGVVVDASDEGRFRTAFAPDTVAPLKLGAVCCTKHTHDFRALTAAGQRTDLDAFLLLGDICYADGAKTRDEFRTHWGLTLDTPEYRQLRRSTSVVPLWDDHEIRNNWEGATLDAALFDTARAAFREHQPLRVDPARPQRLWRRLSWGRTADLFILDARSERDRARGHYLSPEQADWLIAGVTQSQAAFKLILNTVPIGSFDTLFFQPFSGDMWQAYPEQRRQVLEAIDASGTRGVVWVSGDFHLACIGRVGAAGAPGATQLEALVGPGAQAPNALPSYPAGPQWDWASGKNNWAELDLEPATGLLTLRYVDDRGRVFHEARYRP
jgi:alkaline phosphatase D